MQYHLYTCIDLENRQGDSGPTSLGIQYDAEQNKYIVEDNCRPRVGVQIRVGWWQCADITTIVDEDEYMVTFRAGGNTYRWTYDP